ncbi:hypothetical protein [Bradyrhizobium sp.]
MASIDFEPEIRPSDVVRLRNAYARYLGFLMRHCSTSHPMVRRGYNDWADDIQWGVRRPLGEIMTLWAHRTAVEVLLRRCTLDEAAVEIRWLTTGRRLEHWDESACGVDMIMKAIAYVRAEREEPHRGAA